MKKIKFLALTMSALLSVNFVWGENEWLVNITATSDWTVSTSSYTATPWRDESVGVCCNFAANNNKGFAYVRLTPGKKSNKSDADKTGTGHIGTTNKTVSASSNVSFNIRTQTLSSVTSAKLYVYSSYSSSASTWENVYSTKVDEVTIATTDIKVGELTITPSSGTSWKAGVYFVLELGMVNSTTSAKVVEIDKIYTEVAAATPTLETSANSLAFGSIENNTTKSLNTLTVSGSNLTNNITFSITGTNASYFTVTNPASISKGSGTVAATAITVQYAPSATGNHSATLQIISSGATTKEVSLTGTATAPAVHYTVTLLNNGQPVNKGGFDENGQKDYVSGAALGELPILTSLEACDEHSNHFMGWYNGAAITTKQSTAPTLVTPSTTVDGDMTLRAVWAKEQ